MNLEKIHHPKLANCNHLQHKRDHSGIEEEKEFHHRIHFLNKHSDMKLKKEI